MSPKAHAPLILLTKVILAEQRGKSFTFARPSKSAQEFISAMASAQSVESSYEAIAADLASSRAFASKPWEEQLKEMNFALRGRPVMPLVELLRGYGVNSFPQVRTTAMPNAWLTRHLSQ